MFDIDRTFCQRNNKTGLMEWYFHAREGLYGPYETKIMASNELKIFVERRKLVDDDGGRDKTKIKSKLTLSLIKDTDLTLIPLEHTELEPIVYDYAKRKKGIDE